MFLKKRVPTMMQLEITECGAVSLGMIMGFYGRFETLENLRYMCGVSRDGSNAKNIMSAAKSNGFDSKLKCLDEEDLKLEKNPCIIFWKRYHFVVFEFYKNGFYYINDPAKGRLKISKEDFINDFSQFVISLKPNEKFQKKKIDNKVINTFNNLISKSSIKVILFVVVISIVLCIPNIMIPILGQVFIDKYLIAKEESFAYLVIFSLLIFYIILSLSKYIKNVVLKRFELYLSSKLSIDLIEKILRLPMSFFNQRYNGDLISRFRSVKNLSSIISSKLGNILISLFQAFIYFFIIVFYNWILAIIILLLSFVNVVVYYFSKSKRYDLNLRNKHLSSKLISNNINNIKNIYSIRLSCATNFSFINWNNSLKEFLNNNQKLIKLNLLIDLIPSILNIFVNCIILFFLILLSFDGKISIGQIVAFMAIYKLAMEPIMNFVSISSSIQSMEADIYRVNDIYNHREDKIYKVESKNFEHSFLGNIKVKNLSFSYGILDNPVLKNINLEIKEYETVAFVGMSGSYKSTMAKVIAGIYEYKSGSILIDDIDFKDLSIYERSKNISLLSQNIYLFKGTIRENLTFFDNSISNDYLIKACKIAKIYDFICSKKLGFETMVLEGGENFSFGQKQRLEIARAVLQEHNILILDEATSSLDNILEKEIYENFKSLNKTMIIIAHRLKNLHKVDRIYVFDKGEIINQGSHLYLLENCELYKSLIINEEF